LLGGAVPSPRIVLVRRVVLGVAAERGEERRLVVGGAAHPAIREARPTGNGVPARDEIVRARGGAEVSVREAPGTGIGGTREHGLGRRLVERVVEPRHHSGGVAKAGVGRDIRDALAVDPDLAPVAQALQELRPGEWTLGYRRGIE